jgi:hypothetical protein
MAQHAVEAHTHAASITCPRCPGTKFQNRRARYGHIHTAHNNLLYLCSYCMQQFRTTAAVLAHEQKRHFNTGGAYHASEPNKLYPCIATTVGAVASAMPPATAPVDIAAKTISTPPASPPTITVGSTHPATLLSSSEAAAAAVGAALDDDDAPTVGSVDAPTVGSVDALVEVEGGVPRVGDTLGVEIGGSVIPVVTVVPVVGTKHAFWSIS